MYYFKHNISITLAMVLAIIILINSMALYSSVVLYFNLQLSRPRTFRFILHVEGQSCPGRLLAVFQLTVTTSVGIKARIVPIIGIAFVAFQGWYLHMSLTFCRW